MFWDEEKDKIKDMEYSTSRGCYVGEDGSEFHVTPYSDGTGYKYDYYDKSPFNNAPHDSTHVKANIDESWVRVDNTRDEDGKTIDQEKSSGEGCYLTTACMHHFCTQFNDNCDELMTLRWFRDNFVNKEDIFHYYEIAPTIVVKINSIQNNQTIYDWIYNNIVKPCVIAIKNGDYDFAYSRYKNSVLILENIFLEKRKYQKNIKSI